MNSNINSHNPFKISVVIPTRNRLIDLGNLLSSIERLSYPPYEIIVVDDDPSLSARTLVDFHRKEFSGCSILYVEGSGDGLTSARNKGIHACGGQGILFLDDDTLPSKEIISELTVCFQSNPEIKGIQPFIIFKGDYKTKALVHLIENSIHKVFFISYKKNNTLSIRKSGFSVFPSIVEKKVISKRMFGCCCYRRDVFDHLSFDENLRKWSFMEDLDFSVRVNKLFLNSLLLIPSTTIVHKASLKASLPVKNKIHMTVIYWFYIFFKDFFGGSIINLLAFLWATFGNMIVTLSGVLVNRRKETKFRNFIWLLSAYYLAFKNLRNIRQGNLRFFNDTI
jgi:glycosyltransferase involved in cell wall biosynthesis